MIKRSRVFLRMVLLAASMIVFILTYQSGNNLCTILAFVFLCLTVLSFYLISRCPYCRRSIKLRPFEPNFLCPYCGSRIVFE